MTAVDVYPYLIIIGSSILAATAWLLYQSRMQVLRSQELIGLNEKLDHDLPDFLRQCWPSLKQGGFSGISWKLDWFGTEISGENGIIKGRLIEKQFEVQEISLVIRLYLSKVSLEQRYFSRALAESMFLILQMDSWIKLGTVQGAFEQSAKMTVFLQHDVKNMVQLISLTADQLEAPVPGQEQKLIENLKDAVPAVRNRAQNMLNALTNRPSESKSSPQQLEKVLEQTSSIYDLGATITGQATINVQEDTLQSIIDNILGNFSRQFRKANQRIPNLQITLTKEQGFVVSKIIDKNGEPCLWPERLFEPFWSEFGTGRGIGLYQARQQAAALGGTLSVEAPLEGPLCFILSFPLSETQPLLPD